MKREVYKRKIQKRNLGVFLLLILVFTALPLISAYSWGYGYDSPLDYLENEWVQFAVIFIALFLVMYFAMHKPYTENVPLIGILSASLSLLITIALLKRGFLYSYTGEGIGEWIIIIAFIIACIFIFKALRRYFPRYWGIIGLISIALFFILIDIIEIIPGLQGTFIEDFIENITGFSKWIIAGLIIVGIIKVIFKFKRKSQVIPEAPAQVQQGANIQKLRNLERQKTATKMRKLLNQRRET